MPYGSRLSASPETASLVRFHDQRLTFVRYLISEKQENNGFRCSRSRTHISGGGEGRGGEGRGGEGGRGHSSAAPFNSAVEHASV